MQGGYKLLNTSEHYSDTPRADREFQAMDRNTRKIFHIIWFVVQIIGFLNIMLVVVWTDTFMGGFGLQDDPLHEFNYHPLFAVLGLVVFNGNGLLAYRALRFSKKKSLKLLHTALFTFAFIASVLSLKAVFDSHNYRPIPIANMYSLHSWIGLGTVVLFSMQFIFGFVSFLYPGASTASRRIWMPFHRYFGIVTFALAIASCQSGITEKARGAMKEEYQNLPAAAYVANFLGVSLTVYGILLVYLLIVPQYKRMPLQEEDGLQLELRTHSST